jgi:hypothetical protein
MKKILLFAGLLTTQTAFAIVNIENLRMDESQAGLSNSTTVNASGKRGNTDEDEYGIQGGIQYISNQLQRRDLLLYNLKYNQSNRQTYSESYFVHYRHTEQLTPVWAWESFIQHQSEPLNKDAERNVIGMNARYRLSEKHLNGHAGMGVLYEERAIEPDATNRISQELLRFNFYLDSKHPLSDNTNWKINLYAQPKLDDLRQIRSVVNTGITTRINELLSFTVDLGYTHDSHPLISQRRYDFSYKTGINIRF